MDNRGGHRCPIRASKTITARTTAQRLESWDTAKHKDDTTRSASECTCMHWSWSPYMPWAAAKSSPHTHRVTNLHQSVHRMRNRYQEDNTISNDGKEFVRRQTGNLEGSLHFSNLQCELRSRSGSRSWSSPSSSFRLLGEAAGPMMEVGTLEEEAKAGLVLRELDSNAGGMGGLACASIWGSGSMSDKRASSGLTWAASSINFRGLPCCSATTGWLPSASKTSISFERESVRF
mmetsp:Transcript_35105/g.74685  ORF Transcript_35105/g.74685 Transcript_35105/m.74685 type:complete len:233 (-) Transcript_35105:4101-4799(-)